MFRMRHALRRLNIEEARASYRDRIDKALIPQLDSLLINYRDYEVDEANTAPRTEFFQRHMGIKELTIQ